MCRTARRTARAGGDWASPPSEKAYRRGVRVGLLGALEVFDARGQPIELRGAKPRALLAVLSLSPGRVVSTEQIVDALWGEDPPPGVRNGLQGLVSKLRRALDESDVVVTHGAGYALELAPEDVDVHRFEQLVAEGRAAASAGDHETASARFTDASAVWRGDALADFAYDDFARASITRLSELRLAALEEHMACELELGRHAA